MAQPTNIDNLIESVDVEQGIAKDKGTIYHYISLKLVDGTELKWFPDDRSLPGLLLANAKLAKLESNNTTIK